MSIVNENIRNFRIFRGMSQKDLGTALKKTANVISNWETGVHSPDLDNIVRICEVLNVTPNQLFGWEQNEEYRKHLDTLRDYEIQIDRLERERMNIQGKLDTLRHKRNELAHGRFSNSNEG